MADVLFGDRLDSESSGRVRRGVDADIAARREANEDCPAGKVAALRVLADHLDRLDRQLRRTSSRSYDRVPLAQLWAAYNGAYRALFGGVTDEPIDEFAAALRDFTAGGDAARPVQPT